MKRALVSGRWCWQPPYGYKRTVNADNKTALIPDERSKQVVETFRLFISGSSQIHIAEALHVPTSLVTRILTNPLYCGLIQMKWFPDYLPATHQPLISQEWFFKAQSILKGERPDKLRHQREHPDFPLRGFVYCDLCNEKLTAGWCKGRSKRYAHYFCRRGCSVSVKRELMEQAFFEFISSFQPKETVLDLFFAILKDEWNQRRSQLHNEAKSISQRLASAKEKKARIDDLVIRGTLDDDTYRKKIGEINAEIRAREIELSETKIDRTDFDACLAYCRHFILNLGKLWASSPHDVKRKVQSAVFPEGIYYHPNNGLRTASISIIFQQLTDDSALKSALGVPKEAYFEPLFRLYDNRIAA
jgi:hypothetical protein